MPGVSYNKTAAQSRPLARRFKDGSKIVEYPDGTMAIIERPSARPLVAREGPPGKRESAKAASLKTKSLRS